MQKRNVLNSPRLSELKRHRRRVFLNKIFMCLLGLSAIIASLAYLSRLNSMNIDEINISGNKVVDTENINETVKQQLAGKYLWFFPKTNILYYPQNSIKDELQNKFKRLKEINLSIKNNKILDITLTEREALYTWCESVSEQIDEREQKCYFMDGDGYIFDEAPYFSGEVYFKFYGNIEPSEDKANSPLGSYFFKKNFKQLISFRDILKSIGLKPTVLSITKNGDIEISLSGGTSAVVEPKILLRADADFQNAAENLEAALITEPLQSNFKNKYSKLQYIDLRFGNKVYSKFQ